MIADNTFLSLESSLFYFRFGFFTLSIIYVLSRIPNFQNQFFKFLFITYVIVLADAIFQFFIGINSIGLLIMLIYNDINIVHSYGYTYSGEFPSDRLTGFFGKESILGSYLSRLFPFFLVFIFKIYADQISLKKFLLIVIFLIAILVVFLSGERSAFFSILIYLFIFFFVTKFDIKFKFISIFLIIISIVSISFIYKGTFNRMIIKTIDQIYGDYQDDNTENKIKLFSIQHQVVFTSAIRMFKDNTLFALNKKC